MRPGGLKLVVRALYSVACACYGTSHNLYRVVSAVGSRFVCQIYLYPHSTPGCYSIQVSSSGPVLTVGVVVGTVPVVILDVRATRSLNNSVDLVLQSHYKLVQT